MDLMHIYWSLPIPLQNLSMSAYSLVLQSRYYGKNFDYWCDVYNQQEHWSRSQGDQWQFREVKRIIELASKNVPYYRDTFRQLGIIPEMLQKLSDLRKFPILEKDIIRQDARRFLDTRLNAKKMLQDRTSGSTGTPLVIYWPKEMFPKWWALHERRVRAWAGVAQQLPRVMVGGRSIVPGNSLGPYWRYNYHWGQLYMSSYHISPETIPCYINAIRRYGSKWITGYGSAIALLSEWLLSHPEQRPELHAALTSGDTVLLSQRKVIEEGLGCRVFDNYGCAEGCLIISECEYGRMHIQPESGILEIIDEQGNPCNPGQVGEMVITGLLNDAMPLIRYRIGDLAAWSEEIFCPCGRQSPFVANIEGRVDEYLVLPDGRRIGRLSTAIKKSLTIRGAQIVQDAIDHAWLLVLPGVDYKHSHGEIILEDILSRIGSFHIEVREVDILPKTRAGKHRLVVRLFDKPDMIEPYHKQFPEISWRC